MKKCFCYQVVHCGIWEWCIVRFAQEVYCYICVESERWFYFSTGSSTYSPIHISIHVLIHNYETPPLSSGCRVRKQRFWICPPENNRIWGTLWSGVCFISSDVFPEKFLKKLTKEKSGTFFIDTKWNYVNNKDNNNQFMQIHSLWIHTLVIVIPQGMVQKYHISHIYDSLTKAGLHFRKHLKN